ncbi:MAG: DeoR/GlpR family DNA-binding transcription regulator [Clostridiales Family XIII bacterium]|jgi:DeoR family fructose operon transcriptional repressor|nr:DeoR/GlpR family DNA-binding transcription regulator [Clostridiales Family XIII bacterium]
MAIKNTKMFMEERWDKILRELNMHGKVKVYDLCKKFSVTEVTIRNDLLELEKTKKLKRVYGGAIKIEKVTAEETTAQRKPKNHLKKKKIAERAINFIAEGDTLLLDTGTSIFELARILTKFKHLTVVTIDLKIANFLEKNTDFEIIMVGGMVRKGFSCTVGPKAMEFILSFNVDKVILSTNSFTLKRGFMTPNVSHAELKKEMIKKANEIIMLMDSSKVDTISLFTFAEIYDVDILVTDNKTPNNIIKEIKKINKNMDIEVVKCGKEKF